MKNISEIWLKFLKYWWRITIPFRLKRRGLKRGEGVSFYGMPLISMEQGSAINIGDHVVMISHSAFTALGVARPCILRTLTPRASISVGKNTGLSGTVICAASSIEIGEECLFGADVMVADTDFHPINPINRRFAKLASASAEPVVVGNNVFVGARSIILKGVTIGADSVIGAGSLVVSDIPSGVVAAGVPARVLRKVN